MAAKQIRITIRTEPHSCIEKKMHFFFMANMGGGVDRGRVLVAQHGGHTPANMSTEAWSTEACSFGEMTMLETFLDSVIKKQLLITEYGCCFGDPLFLCKWWNSDNLKAVTFELHSE